MGVLIISLQSSTAANISVHPGGSIQSAVNKASAGDTITVYDNNNHPYTYKESVVINKKLFIKSKGTVTIEAKTNKSSVFTVNSAGSGSRIQNFKLTKSSYSVVINNANKCLISGNTISGVSLVGIQFYGNIQGSKVCYNKITGVNHAVGNGISFEYGTSSYNNISSNTIGNFLNGILFNDESCYNLIYKNKISCTSFHGAGIYATDNSNHMEINSNTVTGAEDGIAVQQLGNNKAEYYKIINNTAEYNKNGLWIKLFQSSINHNMVKHNTVSGMDITGTYNQILYNTASYNSNCGITLCRFSSNDHNYVYKNYLTNNKAGINSASHGTKMVSNRVLGNLNNGIISTMNYANLTSNTIENNKGSGILLYGIYNTLKNNYIYNNVIGVMIQRYGSSDHNTITSNTVLKNGNGINSASTLSNFSYNNIYNNKQTGLTITGSKCTIYKNLLNGNGQAGLTVTGTGNNVTENSICNNLYGASFNNGNAAVFNFNRVVGNKYQIYICKTTTALNALNNWWGSNSRPKGIYGSVNVNTWIVLHIASVSKLSNGRYSIVADLSRNSAGTNITKIGHIKDGTLVHFITSQGTIGSTVKTVNGIATNVLKPATGISGGSIKISATLDGQTITRIISI